jgi:hypothetical protein
MTKQFKRYQLELNSIADAESAEYQEKKNKIFKDFLEIQDKNNSEYLQKKDKYASLHCKLNLIESLVRQYQENDSRSTSSPMES